MITLRYELEHSTIPAGAESSTNVAARMSGTVYARLEGSESLDLEYTAFASYQLDWLITRSDGATFRPVFMPPPMPPPGGIPRRTLHLEPSVETAVVTLYGISGFYEEARGPERWGPLPVGRYEAVIRNINLGTGPLATAPFVVLVE